VAEYRSCLCEFPVANDRLLVPRIQRISSIQSGETETLAYNVFEGSVNRVGVLGEILDLLNKVRQGCLEFVFELGRSPAREYVLELLVGFSRKVGEGPKEET